MKFNKKIMKMMPLMLLMPGIMLFSSRNIGSEVSLAKENNKATLFTNPTNPKNISGFFSEGGSANKMKNYLQNAKGEPRYFPVKYNAENGNLAYCLESGDRAPNNDTGGDPSNYKRDTEVAAKNEILYAIESKTNFDDDKYKSYYTRSMVIYELQGDDYIDTAKDPNNTGIITNVKDILAKAKAGGKTTRDVTTSLSPSKVTFTQEGDYYTSGAITLTVNQPSGLRYNAILKGSTVKVTNASSVKIYRANGTEVTDGNIGTDKTFTVKVPKSVGTTDITISVVSTFEVGKGTIYRMVYNESIQDVVLRTRENIEVTSSAKTELVQKGNLKVVKQTDSGAALSGAKFQITTNDGVPLTDVLTTGSTGEIVFKDVPVGTHVLVETSAPWGYIKADNTPVTIYANGESTKTVKNIRDKGDFKVIKKDEYGNPLAGATFQLRTGSTVVQSGTTNANGEILFKNIPTGGYSLVETQAPTGYLVDENQNFKIIEVSSAVVNQVTITNKQIKGNIQITKVDSADGGIKLAGAKFGLYDSSDNLVATDVTDLSGNIIFKDIPYGKYTVKEIEAPAGYFLNSKGHEVSVTNNGETYGVKVYNDRKRDISIDGYNVKDPDGKITGTLEKDKSYSFNVNIKSEYDGLVLPDDAALSTPVIEKLKYAIAVNDGTINQDVASITTSNVKGDIIKSGTIYDTPIKDLSDIWKEIIFKTPNNSSYGEIVIVVEIECSKDSTPNNNRLVVKLPIINEREDEIFITDMEVYPNTSGSAIVGNDVNVKLYVGANSLKTYNVDSKITVTGPSGFGTKTYKKPVYGVSAEEDGYVYYKFKPTVAGKYTISADASIPNCEVSAPSESITVVHPSEPSVYETAINRTNTSYNADSYIWTYVKVEKRDKDKVEVWNHAEPCQKDENGLIACPGHKEWTWNEWYKAFVPRKVTKLSGIQESFNVTEIKFRSKVTEENAKENPLYISTDGYVDLMNADAAKYAQVKAGYGFDLKVKAQYTNNLPTIYNKAYSSNTVPADTRWSEYEALPQSGSKIPYIYADITGDDKTVSVDSQVSSYSGVVSVAVPSLSDLIIENPNQLYIKMPDPSKEYYMVNEGYGTTYSNDKVKQRLYVSDTTGVKLTSTEYSETKQFEFKKSDTNTIDKRGYYISKEVKDGTKVLSFYNRYAGYGLNNGTRLHDRKDVAIKVLGGRYDDIKDSEQ